LEDLMDLGAIHEPVPFDFGVASALVTACRTAASAVDGQVGDRYSFVHTGSVDFKGLFSELFAQNALTAAGDATEVAMSLRAMADGAERLATEARAEQQRRDTAKAWVAQQKARSNWDKVTDWVKGGDDPPVTAGAEPRSVPVAAAPTRPRQTPHPAAGGSGRRGSGRGGGPGTCGASLPARRA
jgi:hypothetical protein